MEHHTLTTNVSDYLVGLESWLSEVYSGCGNRAVLPLDYLL